MFAAKSAIMDFLNFENLEFYKISKLSTVDYFLLNKIIWTFHHFIAILSTSKMTKTENLPFSANFSFIADIMKKLWPR